MRVDDDYGDPYGNFSDPSRGISAEVVTIEITDAGPGGTSLYSPVCGLLADVKDPDADWAALMQGLHVEGQSIAWSREDPTTGIYLRDGKELNIYLSEPQLKGKVYLPEGACGDLPDCVGWGSAYIAVRESR